MQRRRLRLVALVGLAVLVVGAWLQGHPQEPRGGAVSVEREAAYRENNIGVARLEQFDAKRASASFRKALAAAPDLVIARVNLAIAHFYVPDLSAARTEAEAAARAAPDRPQPHYILGLIAKSENRIEEAKAAFKRVLAIDARDVGALVNLGQLEMQERAYDAANALFERAVEAEPYNATAAYNLAVAFMRAGRRDEGAKAMARFQKLRESGVATTFSNAYLEQGRYAQAITSTGAEPGLVDEAIPAVAFVAAPDALPAPEADATGAPKSPGGGVTLIDLDRDGDLDLLRAEQDLRGDEGTLRAYANDKGRFTDVSDRVGLGAAVASITPFASIGGDYDNDDRVDLFVLGAGGGRLLRQREDGRFEDRTEAAKLPPSLDAHPAASFVDLDHDGDLDLVLLAAQERQDDGANGRRAVVLRNNGDGTFGDIAEAAGLAGVAGSQVVPTDVDNRRDVDLLIAGSSQPPRLFRNMRDGTFQDEAAELGLPTTPTSAATAADVNKDGFTDFFFSPGGEGAAAHGVLSLSTDDGSFTSSKAGPHPQSPGLSQFLDYDNDGLLDLLVSTSQGFRLWRNLGSRWEDVSDKALPSPLREEAVVGRGFSPAASQRTSFATGDLDGDGDTDLVVRGADARVTIWRNDGGNVNRSVHVRLTAQVSNRSAYGAKVEMRAGSLWQKLEYVSAWPQPAPADVSFGLGQRTGADVVRVLWPAGIVQAEIPPAAPESAEGAQVVSLTELDRKPSSCPYLFTWNGERFEFVTDFLGGGEMGYLVAPGVFNTPDPIEYVRIRGDQLRPRSQRYELRVTNELEETLYLDRVRLLAVTHRADDEVYPDEGMTHTPKPFRLFAVRNARVPARATDHAGRDVINRIARLDGRFVDRLPLEKIRGYAKRHALTLDLSPPPVASGPGEPDGQLLLLTGWTDYAFSSDNLAAHQAGLELVPPFLQVKDRRGRWRTVIDDIGVPVGRPQTVPVDLTGKWLSDNREVRIVTSMRVYWDLIRVATPGSRIENESGNERVTVEQLDPVGARLAWRGFSAEAAVTADDRQPLDFDYERVTFLSPWKVMRGRYTREGDVLPLLQLADEKFVVSRPGDEVALSFDAMALAPLPEGHTRTFLLYADGFSKEMDVNSASPDLTLPLPYHEMTRYPYSAPEAYPDTPAHRRYLDEYNTRVVGRDISPIETAVDHR